MKLNKAIGCIAITFFAFILFFVTGCRSMGTNISESKNKIVRENVKESYVPNLAKDVKIYNRVYNNKDNTNLEQRKYGYKNGDKYLKQYNKINAFKKIVLVEQTKEVASEGTLFLLIKNESGVWQEILRCKANLGKNGIDKTREGDARTPTGEYGFLMAFGAKENPGSLIPYTKLTDTMYLCGDKEYYNQFIDVSKVDHHCSDNSEHLIRYIPQYNYGLFIDYNKEGVFRKGSAIFLHCFGNYPYTMGCVSVAEENMVKILRTVDSNSRICIYQSS